MAIGRVKDIQNLSLYCKSGSSTQAVAGAVTNAHSLRKLEVNVFPSDPPELIALANALQHHPSLQKLYWYDRGSWREAVLRDFSVDTILRALQACPHLRKVSIATERASADAFKNMLQMQSATELRLVLKTTDRWLMVTDEIRQSRCNVQKLILSKSQGTISSATEAVQVLASAIR
jgi:hypothetical protein